MTESRHQKIRALGLFDGPVDAEAVATWPAWAREHLSTCPSCRSLLSAERMIHEAVSTLRSSDARGLRRGPPTRAERQARLAARRAPALGAVVEGQQALAQQVMRFEGDPLELYHTPTGLRVWHPDARELLVLATDAQGEPFVLEHHHAPTPGAGLEISYAPEHGSRVLALASRQPLDQGLWEIWLKDALGAGQLEELVRGNRSQYVHAAELTIEPALSAALVRLREDPLPDASPGVTALLQQAAAAGRAEDVANAARLYREALECAFAEADPTGRIKAGIGLAYALKGMGYPVDGDKVLRWVLDNHTLDAIWAQRVCQHMATDALYRLDLEQAEEWLARVVELGGETNAWYLLILSGVRHAQRDWPRLEGITSRLEEMDLPAAQRSHLLTMRASALARQGAHAEAARLASRAVDAADLPLDGYLQRRELDVLIDRGGAGRADWDALLGGVLRRFQERDGELLTSWDYPYLHRLVELALEDTEPAVAATLQSLRFLDTVRALDADCALLGVSRSHAGHMRVARCGGLQVGDLGLGSEQLSKLVASARNELRSGDGLSACRMLAQLLFQGMDLDSGPMWVGSDGALADVPLLALAASVSTGEVPAFRELIGSRRPPPRRDPACTRIVSLADAGDDLPWASEEVQESEAELRLRGDAVTRERLATLGSCGLLHLGLHARREQGIPKLLFADGPLGPMEIAALSLPGAPVVLLAGCFTAVTSTDVGVERSLADAFLRAGASAVIATKWPVCDAEMHHFVRALVEAWPFDDVACVVRDICLDLKRRGHPARCWAAPVVY